MYDRLKDLLIREGYGFNTRSEKGILTQGEFYKTKVDHHNREDRLIARHMTQSGNPTKPAKVKSLRHISAALGNPRSRAEIQARQSANAGLNHATQNWKRYQNNVRRDAGLEGDHTQN